MLYLSGHFRVKDVDINVGFSCKLGLMWTPFDPFEFNRKK